MGWERVLTDLGLRAEWRTTKFVAYFQLVDACAQPGCPVCRCVRESTFRALDALLYEQVTDPATRAVLDRSWGFCNWHAWMARDVRNAGLGLAIIHEDLLGQLRARLAATQRDVTTSAVVRGWRRLFGRRQPVRLVQARALRARCPPCTMLGGAEPGYLRVVLDYVETPEFDRAYARSTGLCLPHLTQALADFHPGAGPLLARSIRKLDALARELRGFIDKHDYRKRAPFTDAEATSWTDALALLVGQRELFGNEIPRAGVAAEATSAPEPKPEAESAEGPRERLETVASETRRLELEVSEMNPAGERAAARTWEGVVHDLRVEIADLKMRLAKYEPPPVDPA